MKKEQKSFSQELCENKALISAANTTDLVSLISPVNYSEETAELIAGLTNTSVDYVKGIMDETTKFSQNFSEEGYPKFINALNENLEKNSETINNNFNEYMKNIENFSEEDANNKVEKLSDLISIIDDEVIKDLGTDYIAMVIANSTDTDEAMLKRTLDSYLAGLDKDANVEEKKEEVKEVMQEKKDEPKVEEKTETVDETEESRDVFNENEEVKTDNEMKYVIEKFNEVFIKKDGQYYKFDDATVSVPKNFEEKKGVTAAGALVGTGAGLVMVEPGGYAKRGLTKLTPKLEELSVKAHQGLVKIGNEYAVKNPKTMFGIHKIAGKVSGNIDKLAKGSAKLAKNISNPKVAIPVIVGTTITGAVTGKKLSK